MGPRANHFSFVPQFPSLRTGGNGHSVTQERGERFNLLMLVMSPESPWVECMPVHGVIVSALYGGVM